MWAAGDPLYDPEVAKIDAPQFFSFLRTNSKYLSAISGHKSVVKTIFFLKLHAKKAGADHINWTKVFTKLYAQEFKGQSVKRFRGLQSLIWWLFRNTGSGSICPPYCQERYISFILANKKTLWKFIREKKQKLLAKLLYQISSLTDCNYIEWKKVVSFLIRKRKLFLVPNSRRI